MILDLHSTARHLLVAPIDRLAADRRGRLLGEAALDRLNAEIAQQALATGNAD